MTADLADIDARWLHGQTGEWKELAPRAAFASRAQVLGLCVALSQPVAGHIVEFGVWQGASTRAIRDALRRTRRWDRAQRAKRIYACDSFEGLPESYEHLSAGTFATPVPRLRGVRIVKGYFEDSLTPELAREVSRVSLAHLDADLVLLDALRVGLDDAAAAHRESAHVRRVRGRGCRRAPGVPGLERGARGADRADRPVRARSKRQRRDNRPPGPVPGDRQRRPRAAAIDAPAAGASPSAVAQVRAGPVRA